jgi:hypothetical protein
MRTTFLQPALVLLTALLFSFSSLKAADFYWVGGSGNWSDYSHHWATSSGGNTFQTRTPSPNDDVFFDANSFPSPGGVVTVDQSVIYVRSMFWTGVTNNPRFTSTPNQVITTDQALRIFGSLALSAAMTYDFWGPVSFEATTTGQTIRSAGKIFFNEVTFRGAGGEWTLQDDFSITEDYGKILLRLLNGTLNTNNKTVSVPQFTSVSTAPRSLVLGASEFNITQGDWWVELDGMTLDAGTSVITLRYTYGSGFTGGGHTYYAVAFKSAFPNGSGTFRSSNDVFNGPVTFATDHVELGAVNSIFNADVTFQGDGVMSSDETTRYNGTVTLKKKGTFYGNSTFNNLTFTPGNVYTLESGKTLTLLGQLTATGTGSQPINIQSSLGGTPATLQKASGTVCLDYVYLSDINATGGAVFNAGKAPERSLDLGGNSGWLFMGGCSAVVLPVKLSSFEANCLSNNGVLLKWRTASETSGSSFTLEKSTDGRTFYTIASINGTGNTTQARNYTYADNELTLGKSFYRLRLSEKDGHVTYSEIVTAACNESNKIIEVYPNPTRGNFLVRIASRFARADAALYNSLGNKVYQITEHNSNVIRVNAASLSTGVYFLRVLVNGSRIDQKIILE